MKIEKLIYKDKEGEKEGLFIHVIGGFKKVNISHELFDFQEIISRKEVNLNTITGEVN